MAVCAPEWRKMSQTARLWCKFREIVDIVTLGQAPIGELRQARNIEIRAGKQADHRRQAAARQDGRRVQPA